MARVNNCSNSDCIFNEHVECTLDNIDIGISGECKNKVDEAE